jgi:hypothetical protein
MFNTTYRTRKIDYSVGKSSRSSATRFQRKILGGAGAPPNRLPTAPAPS